MTAKKRVFLTSDNFSSRIVGTYLTAIVISPLDYMATHSGSVQNLETVSIQNTVLTETAFVGYDALANIGKYCTNNVLGVYYILVDSAVITNDTLAKGWITGMQIVYNLISLKYFGSTPLYSLKTTYSSGQEVGSTSPTTLEILSAKIDVYSEDIDVNLNGWYEFLIKRSLQAT